MGRWLVLLVLLVFLVSSCSTGKTIPVVSDVVAEGNVPDDVWEEVNEPVEEDVVENETEDEINETVDEESASANEESGEQETEVEEELADNMHKIIIQDLKLLPKEIIIKKGDTVIWENKDQYETEGQTKHLVAAHDNEFRSGILVFGDKFEHTFNNEGTFTYIDVFYKDRNDLRGKIIVE